MRLQADREVLVEIVNGRVPDPNPADQMIESTGLGTNLMKAFAMQLGGPLDLVARRESYTVRVRFVLEGFNPDV